MIHPAPLDLRAYRGAPFTYAIDFYDVDYSAATFRLEVRRYRDAPGAPLVALGNAAPQAEGVSCTVSTFYDRTVSTVAVRVNETTVEAQRMTSPRGGDLVLAYALDVTGGGHGKARRAQGAFIIEASANG